jgi:hypothetical protein
VRIASGILWLIVAVVAALMGVLLISDEPGATATISHRMPDAMRT